MFLLCIYIIFTHTTRKGSHRYKRVHFLKSTKKKVKIREPHKERVANCIMNSFDWVWHQSFKGIEEIGENWSLCDVLIERDAITWWQFVTFSLWELSSKNRSPQTGYISRKWQNCSSNIGRLRPWYRTRPVL